MRVIALMALATIAGCGNSEQDMGACEMGVSAAVLSRPLGPPPNLWPGPEEKQQAANDFQERAYYVVGCMKARGYEYRAERCPSLVTTDRLLVASCFAKTGLLRTAELAISSRRKNAAP